MLERRDVVGGAAVWFVDDRVKAVLAYYASIGTFAGPKTPGSAYVIMHHAMGALAAYGRTVGVEIRTAVPHYAD